MPWFENWPGSAGGEDFNFCNKAREHGFKVYADMSVQCAHAAQLVFIGREDFKQVFGVGTEQEHDWTQPIWVEAGPSGRTVRLGKRPDDGFVFPKDVEGYLTEDQGRLLWEFANRTPADGLIVELGAYKGKSTICLAQAGRRVWTFDSFEGEQLANLDDQLAAKPDHLSGNYRQALEENLAAAGVADNVRIFAQSTHENPPSAADISTLHDGVDLLFVDAAHDYESVSADIARWEWRMRPEGTIILDDCNFEGVAQVVSELGQRGWRHIGHAQTALALRRAHQPAPVPVVVE